MTRNRIPEETKQRIRDLSDEMTLGQLSDLLGLPKSTVFAYMPKTRKRKRHGRQLSQAKIAYIKRYAATMTVAEMMARLKIGRSTVIRYRPKEVKKGYKRVGQAERARIAELMLSHPKQKKRIAYKFGVHMSTLWRISRPARRAQQEHSA
jgi:methylphosphotriester-DNA--protein-cysteine methyltransferase